MSELLEKILDKRNMNEAYKKVCANKGAGGVIRYINGCLVKWVRRKYKKRKARRKAELWLGEIAKRDRNLFAHWKFGILPSAG